MIPVGGKGIYLHLEAFTFAPAQQPLKHIFCSAGIRLDLSDLLNLNLLSKLFSPQKDPSVLGKNKKRINKNTKDQSCQTLLLPVEAHVLESFIKLGNNILAYRLIQAGSVQSFSLTLAIRAIFSQILTVSSKDNTTLC